MDFKKELEKIAEDANEKKLEKARLEERQRQLEKDKKEVLGKLKDLDIPEDKLDEWIKKEEASLNKEIDKCKEILNLS